MKCSKTNQVGDFLAQTLYSSELLINHLVYVLGY